MRPRYVALPPLAALALALAAAAPAPAAVVQLTPAAAPPGARAHVAGAGFVPGRPVLVRLAGRTVAAGATPAPGSRSPSSAPEPAWRLCATAAARWP